jgi:hypothetical protein
MIKQAAVTGHTSGLGNSFFRLLSNQGYQVHGFSRTNGYDLRDYSCVTDMLTQIKGFDLFINNAKPDYAQSQIVYRLSRDWTSGTIISIGSQAVIQNPGWTDTFLMEYLTQKIALCHAHQLLQPVTNCQLVIVHPRHLEDNTDLYVKQLISELNL